MIFFNEKIFDFFNEKKIYNPHDFHIHTVLVNYNEWSSLDVCVHCSLRPTESLHNGAKVFTNSFTGSCEFASSQNAGLIQIALSKVDKHEHL